VGRQLNEKRSKCEGQLSINSVDLGEDDGGPEWGMKSGSRPEG